MILFAEAKRTLADQKSFSAANSLAEEVITAIRTKNSQQYSGLLFINIFEPILFPFNL